MFNPVYKPGKIFYLPRNTIRWSSVNLPCCKKFHWHRFGWPRYPLHFTNSVIHNKSQENKLDYSRGYLCEILHIIFRVHCCLFFFYNSGSGSFLFSSLCADSNQLLLSLYIVSHLKHFKYILFIFQTQHK